MRVEIEIPKRLEVALFRGPLWGKQLQSIALRVPGTRTAEEIGSIMAPIGEMQGILKKAILAKRERRSWRDFFKPKEKSK